MITTLTARMVAGAALFLAAGAASAQESTNRVAVETAWSVFVEKDPAECWSVSAPKETVNTKDGRTVAVRRGDVLLFVTFRPGSGVKGEVSFTGGYPFAEGSRVAMDIGGIKFDLFTEGEWAWPASESDDAAILAAMKRGAEAVLSAGSSRGTKTQDTFSLFGFSAAVDEAAKRCAE